MTQHINLLTQNRAQTSKAWLAATALVGLLLMFLVWGGLDEVSLQRLALSHVETQQTVMALRTALKKQQREAGLEDAQALAKDSEQMQRTLEQNRTLMQLLQKGDIGSRQGHSAVLQTLATLPQAGVWLHEVDISRAGQAVSISGTALTTEAVLQYAQQLNQSFNAKGIAFSSLALSKEELSGTATATKSSVFKFKLD